MLYHVAIFDPEKPGEEGYAQHSNKYLALLTALLSIHARATHANFKSNSYGALEGFYPPTGLQALEDYCTDIGYTVQWRGIPINEDAYGTFDWP